jgi:hypothetical protein
MKASERRSCDRSSPKGDERVLLAEGERVLGESERVLLGGDDHAPLVADEILSTTEWLASRQKPSGEIPWADGLKMDPWDHVHSAIGLCSVGRVEQARAAYEYMVQTQEPNGGWAAERRGGKVTRSTQESNHAAYFATGVWHMHCHKPDPAFLAAMWPAVDRSIEFVLSMQLASGAIAWAQKSGKIWAAPLLTGCSSVHGSLVCAIRIAERLGHERAHWHIARERLAHVLRHQPAVFTETDLPEKPGRHSMDWYYPVLGGALRGTAGRNRLLDPELYGAFVQEGVGCRCVKDKPWYTIAETCELVLALHACGLTARARSMLSWTRWLRSEEGAYWTGATHPDHVIFPEGEKTTWTAAAVLIANDALHQKSATSDFFRSLSGADFAPMQSRQDLPARAGYDELRTAAE